MKKNSNKDLEKKAKKNPEKNLEENSDKNFERLKKILTFFNACLINGLILMNTSIAVEITDVPIKSGGSCGDLLMYNGAIIEKNNYAYYETKNSKYVAYCLDQTKKGVTDSEPYTVYVVHNIQDDILWRYITNGFPYKSMEELGCNTKEEAYTATQQAVYCYIHGYDVNKYEAIGEAGERTLQALKKIVQDAQNSQEVQVSKNIKITPVDEYFTQDAIDSKYASKTYEIHANTDTYKYFVMLEKADSELCKGIKVTDVNNQPITEFQPNEKIKVLIPIEELSKGGLFKLMVHTNVYTKPILYGMSDDDEYQDYALVTKTYEMSQDILIDEYFEKLDVPEVPDDEKEESEAPDDEKEEPKAPDDEKEEPKEPEDKQEETETPEDKKEEQEIPDDKKEEPEIPNDKKEETEIIAEAEKDEKQSEKIEIENKVYKKQNSQSIEETNIKRLPVTGM